MEDPIFQRAKELFGEQRFEEIMGELWLQRDRLAARAAAGGLGLDTALREWENRFRRDVEEGRHRIGRNRRYRVMRFSEVEAPEGDEGAPPEDYLRPHIRRSF